MDRGNRDNRGHDKWTPWDADGDETGGDRRQKWSIEKITQLLRNHPEYRIQEDPWTCELIQMVLVNPDDPDAQEMLSDRIREHEMAYLGSGDAFWGTYPNPGSMLYPPDFLFAGQMPTGDPIGLAISQLPGNIGILGPTRSGKTNLLAHLFISNPHLLRAACIIAFVKKPELRHLVTVPQLARCRISVFREPHLAISVLQPPSSKVPQDAWNNEFVRLIAQCYARFSAQRLLGDVVNDLMTHRPEGVYPTLRQVADAIDDLKPHWGSRESGYKESISFVLHDLLNCTGGMWDYSYSTFLEVLTSSPGLAIIELESVAQEHLTFIASFVARWVYFQRLYGGSAIL